MGRAGERREDLLAVDRPAAGDLRRERAEGRFAGSRGAALGERLSVDRPVLHYAPEVQRAVRLVLALLLRCHVEVVGKDPGPQRRAGVHVEGEGGCAAVLADRRGDDGVAAQVGTHAAESLRHAQPEQAGRAQIVVILEWEARLAVVARGARGEFRSERLGDLYQIALAGDERIVRSGHRIARVNAHRLPWRMRRSRKSPSTRLNSSGWSIGPR